ncbi:MAG: MFS transporter [Spirochaetes bacterium]|nr:MFS transporter [Spirochaetota bacterium]
MQTREEKFNFYKTTILIGLGFFTMGLMDPLYDAFVPLFLKEYIKVKTIIGSIMTLDNIFALFLIPIVAAISDRTITKIGRRMPYILVTLPLSAIFFALIPFAALKSLFLLILVLFLLNIFKQAARGPVVALMPDIIHPDYRSEANGVINFMGGIAAIVGTVGLSKLMDLDIYLPIIGRTKDKIPFLISGILVVFATILLFIFVKEKFREKTEKEEKIPIIKSFKLIFSDKDKSAVLILFSLFLWFFGYQGVLPFVTTYAVEIIGVSKGVAGISPGMVAIPYALFAIPSGIIAHKIGRKKMIRICLIGLIIAMILMFFHKAIVDFFQLKQGLSLIIFWAILFFFGIFWGSVVTNSFPMLWQMATYSNMGIYTGLYYTFSQSAAIFSPPVTGAIIDLINIRAIFLFAAICMLGAFILMGFVKKGEPSTTKTH